MFIARDQLGITDVELEVGLLSGTARIEQNVHARLCVLCACQVIVGSLNLVAVLGAFIARPVCDHFGRTRTLALASFLFLAGSTTVSLASTFPVLLGGRFLLGIGVGSGLAIDPLCELFRSVLLLLLLLLLLLGMQVLTTTLHEQILAKCRHLHTVASLSAARSLAST